jgi:2-polyprenyl-6-hydroxyphenyl methylase/3-demethylubiquinone-9 3-methyltransferase
VTGARRRARGRGGEAALARAYNRGLAAEKRGDLDAAAAAYAEALALDPDDRGGVSVRLAAIGRGGVPEKAPDAYVATLFDQCAERFDEMLVEQLGYHVPMLLRQRLGEVAPGPYARMLDLGCGTGLTGASLADMAGEITGVDLAEGMLAQADERGAYAGLWVGEAVAFLEETDEGPWNLVAATDVLPYLGALEGFFAGAARRLSPGGVLAVSCETLPAMARDYTVGPKHRFAHSEGYLRRLMAETGFAALDCAPITVRYDDGAPVPGLLLIARRG